jgi:hypothetical protein
MMGSVRVRASGAQMADEAEAVEPGHHDVTQHQVGRIGLRQRQGGKPVLRGLHHVACTEQASDVAALYSARFSTSFSPSCSARPTMIRAVRARSRKARHWARKVALG